MNLAELRDAVAAHADGGLALELADGRRLANHFHVTEVGRVTKDFVDCGGVRRTEVRCVLQTLVAADTNHRLGAAKFAKILALADKLDLPADAPVELEHQERSVSVDAVATASREGDTLVLRLAPKQTACLAEDACGAPPAVGAASLPVVGAACCGESGCC